MNLTLIISTYTTSSSGVQIYIYFEMNILKLENFWLLPTKLYKTQKDYSPLMTKIDCF